MSKSKREGRSCHESALGVHDPDRFGKCSWCARRVCSPMPKPTPKPIVSELEHYYRTTYDPDYNGEIEQEWRY